MNTLTAGPAPSPEPGAGPAQRAEDWWTWVQGEVNLGAVALMLDQPAHEPLSRLLNAANDPELRRTLPSGCWKRLQGARPEAGEMVAGVAEMLGHEIRRARPGHAPSRSPVINLAFEEVSCAPALDLMAQALKQVDAPLNADDGLRLGLRIRRWRHHQYEAPCLSLRELLGAWALRQSPWGRALHTLWWREWLWRRPHLNLVLLVSGVGMMGSVSGVLTLSDHLAPQTVTRIMAGLIVGSAACLWAGWQVGANHTFMARLRARAREGRL